jgi:superfamily II DNA helicase RecQ
VKLCVFSLHLDEHGAFDDESLRDFCERHQVVSVHDHLLQVDGAPMLALLVSYRERVRPGAVRGSPPSVSDPPSAVVVPEVDRAVFDALRRWRNSRAKQDGRPPYVLFRNSHLVEIAARRPKTLAQLAAIEGIGEGKLRDYGPEVLALLAELPAEAPGKTTATGPISEEPDDG